MSSRPYGVALSAFAGATVITARAGLLSHDRRTGGGRNVRGASFANAILSVLATEQSI